MKEFMDENFLLPNHASERLYHEYAKDMPIFDYHSHLPAGQVAGDVKFDNITQAWLYGDHRKWRAMRACGVPEELVSGIPGAAGDYLRFEAWAKAVPQTIGNPLYHWSHLELRRYFDIRDMISADTARKIYDRCSELLAEPGFSVRSIIRRSNVSIVCTTDDPADDLKDHIALSKENWGCGVNPTWRPDRAFALNDAPAFNSWIDRLEAASGKSVSSYGDFLNALQKRHDFFHECGCRLSDYGIERPYAEHYASLEVERAFRKIRAGAPLSGDVLEHCRASILHDLLCMDARANWTQQIRLGANRNNSGTGRDSIGQSETGTGLVTLFSRLESEGCLARTIIYTLNPNDYDMIASIMGSFMDGKTPGKMQMGAAWWHNDHKDGISRQFSVLAGIGLISRFVGTLTGSRSFLSYPRHEYFRRLLCAKFGTDMENGELPPDFGHIGGIVRDICFNNAVKYFGMGMFIPSTAKRGE